MQHCTISHITNFQTIVDATFEQQEFIITVVILYTTTPIGKITFFYENYFKTITIS